jgi:hypothetical protein
MSEIIKGKVKITDFDLLNEICESEEIKTKYGKHTIFNKTIEGLGIFIDGWKFPIVVDKDGTILYDNYGSNPGSMEKFSSLCKDYIKRDLEIQGFNVTELVETEDQYKLLIAVGE